MEVKKNIVNEKFEERSRSRSNSNREYVSFKRWIRSAGLRHGYLYLYAIENIIFILPILKLYLI